jgi:HK97 gp10 family phage protein
MSNSIEVEVKGLDDLETKLKELGDKLAKKHLRKALRAGGKVLQEAIVERAPVATGETPEGHDPGTLRDSVRPRISLSSVKEEGKVSIGPGKSGWYGKFSEFGTRNEPARPWIRPAFDSSAQSALDAFVDALKQGLQDETK